MTNFICLLFGRIGASLTMERNNIFICLLFARIGASLTMERNNKFHLFVVCQNRFFINYGEK